MELSGKKVVVLGLGKSGIAASRLLLSKGVKVSVSEARETASLQKSAKLLKREGIVVELGGHSRKQIEGQDLIVTSPGVPLDSSPLRWAREERIPIWSEIELGYHFCKGKIIAVTGSNGKSTTVTLLGKMLEAAKKKVFVCGNIGEAFCKVIPKIQKKDWIVLEVSSFQLEQCHAFRPHIAAVLNIAPNHLDRHTSFEEYLLAKRRIAKSQTENDFLLLNADDPFARNLGRGLSVRNYYFSRTEKVNGVFMKEKEVWFSLQGVEEKICTLRDLRVIGPHNEENALSAILAALLAGVGHQAIQKTLVSFEGLPHRIEFVGEKRGIRFVNDSKSTTVSSTLRALETIPSPIFLIAGGRGKNEDFSAFAKSPLLKKIKQIFLIGEEKLKIDAAVGKQVKTSFAVTLEEAVGLAYRNASAGETILLSPMCTSFDMFENFEERGDCFKESATAFLKGEKKSAVAENAHAR